MGFVVVSSPESFISDDDKPLQVLAREEDDQLAQEYWYFKLNLTEDAFSHVENRSRERHHFQTLRMHLINEGIEMVLGSLITIVVSGLVIYGIKKSQSAWLLPWLVIQISELVIGMGMFLVYIMSGVNFSVVGTLSVLIIFAMSAYLTYATMSYYILMRTLDKHSNNIISSVMDVESYGIGSSVNYEQLSRGVSESVSPDVTRTPNPMASRAGANQSTFRNEDLPYFSI
ncbi:uncharacterized protein LOC131890330 isoform X2 [Tigriopus californicus]|nr:uncharacterized protein LOC131890330 isoform X2 [Tigriopus californicus]